MIGEYSCPYLCNTGKAYENSCIRPEGCRFHWKAKKWIPYSDCGKPTSSACGRCPLHVRGYYVIQFYDRLRSEKQKGTYEQIMDAHRDALVNLNITLCRECFHLIKVKEGKYCDSCRPE